MPHRREGEGGPLSVAGNVGGRLGRLDEHHGIPMVIEIVQKGGVASEPVPDRFLSLLDALDAAESSSKAGSK